MSTRRANRDSRVVSAKLARVMTEPAATVNRFVVSLRERRPDSYIPYVDPDCGCTRARILMLFQDPGPKAAPPGGSGLLSISNDDPSAATLHDLLAQAGIPWADVMPWNAVPWYTGGRNSSTDRREGLRTLDELTRLLPRLQVVVTFGRVAASSWETATGLVPSLARYRHIATLHPSVRGQTRGGHQRAELGRAQLLRDLRDAKAFLT